MADIQVPQTNPNAPQVVNPFPIVDSYLNRQQQAQQYLGQSAIGLGERYNTLRQQKIARQMDALKAISDLYGAGGRRAVQSYGPTVNQVAGTQLIPPDQAQQPSSVPMGGVGGGAGNQGGSVLSDPAIQNHAQSIGWDLNHPAYTAPQPSPQDIQDIQSGGKYGQSLGTSYKDLGDIAMQPLAAQQKQNEIAMQPTEQALKQQQLENAQAQVPQEIGGKQSEVQQKFNVQDQKMQAGFKALQDLNDAWEAVPANLKGPATGSLTKKAGSLFSGASPELTSFNKQRALAISTLATALLPESARANPAAIKEFSDNFPTTQSSQQEKDAVLRSIYSDLSGLSNTNYSGNQAAAKAFGGNLAKPNVPKMNFGAPPITKVINGQSFIKKDGRWYHQ